jgi:hypothetical protein
MHSSRSTPEYLLEIERELADREPIFHRPQYGTTRADFEAMTAEDFWEVGASGARYDRQQVLAVLDERAMRPGDDAHWTTEDFYCQEIAEGHYLLTYTLRQGARVTRRATLWRRRQSDWVIVYHQGTIVDTDA